MDILRWFWTWNGQAAPPGGAAGRQAPHQTRMKEANMSGRNGGSRTAGIMALALPVALAACGSDDVAGAVEELNLVETAAEAGSFQTLLAAVAAAGLEETLAEGGPFTVFAPTDAAFESLPAGVLEAVLADRDLLTAVLLYHVVPGRIMSGDLMDGQIVTTAEGREFRVTLSGGPRVNEVNVIATDVEASNGVIHVIDGVLIPVNDNVDTAVGAGFSTLVAAVQAADLESVLRSDGPLTIFAPTDEAFANLPAGALEALLADGDALASVLTYHVVSGRVFVSDLADGMEVMTVGGRAVTISLAGGARVNGASIVATDILTSNGVIHVIDAVLIPGD
jgi:transforming growth factor-beta-induced protein